MEISDEFGRNLERCQLRNVKLNKFFNSVSNEPFCFPPEFFESEPFLESDSDSASSCILDLPGTGSELGDSEENLEVAACQLCDLNFGWLQDDSNHVDSGLLCSMFESDDRDVSGTQPGTASGPLHQAVNFEYGLQGVEVSCSQDVASDLLSPNCHRIHLQKFGVSTFLNLQDTVSHACQLHQFSPVLHPLLSEIMMGNESQHWWLLDSGAAATVMATASRATC